MRSHQDLQLAGTHERISTRPSSEGQASATSLRFTLQFVPNIYSYF